MGRKNGSFLLDEADQLRISDSVTLVYRSLTKIQEERLPITQQQEKQSFASRYVITGRVLGIGGYGRVLIAVHQKTQRQLACKVIDIRNFYEGGDAADDRYMADEQGVSNSAKRWPSRVGKCFREFDILKDLSHVRPPSCRQDSNITIFSRTSSPSRKSFGAPIACKQAIQSAAEHNSQAIATSSKNLSQVVISSRTLSTRAAAYARSKPLSSSGRS
jgi:hypothetical protein